MLDQSEFSYPSGGRKCLKPRGAQLLAGRCPSENLKRELEWGQRRKCLGSCLTHTGKVGMDGAVTEPKWVLGRFLPSLLDCQPLEIPGASPNYMLHILFLLTVHLQRLTKHRVPRRPGCYPPKQKALRWKPQLSLREDSYAASWLPSTWMENPGDQTACPAAAPCCWVASGEQTGFHLPNQSTGQTLSVLCDFWVPTQPVIAQPRWGDTDMKQVRKKTRR